MSFLITKVPKLGQFFFTIFSTNCLLCEIWFIGFCITLKLGLRAYQRYLRHMQIMTAGAVSSGPFCPEKGHNRSKLRFSCYQKISTAWPRNLVYRHIRGTFSDSDSDSDKFIQEKIYTSTISGLDEFLRNTNNTIVMIWIIIAMLGDLH